MYGESFSTPELILAFTVLIILPALLGFLVEIFDVENRRK